MLVKFIVHASFGRLSLRCRLPVGRGEGGGGGGEREIARRYIPVSLRAAPPQARTSPAQLCCGPQPEQHTTSEACASSTGSLEMHLETPIRNKAAQAALKGVHRPGQNIGMLPVA